LEGIPEVFYEGAELDGATAWQRFRFVTLPLLNPTIVVLAEIVPAVVAWNEGPLAHLAGHPLLDPQLRTQIGLLLYDGSKTDEALEEFERYASKGDVFVIPPWLWHEHVNAPGGDAVFLAVTDRPILDAFRLYREEARDSA